MPRGRHSQTPEWAKEDSEKRILEALHKGERTNQQLLDETKLSGPTLSARLTELEKNNRVVYSIKEGDRRSKIYKLTLAGANYLVKKRVTNNLSLTSLFLNFDTLKLEEKKRKTISHISAAFELKNRKSKILERIEKDFLKQFECMMEKKYPSISKAEIEKNSKWAIERLLDQFNRAFELSVFSSLKIKSPGSSEYRILSFDPIYPTIKYDYYALLFIDLFERFLDLVYDTFRTQFNGNLEKFLIALTQNGTYWDKKMMLVMSFDLGCIPWVLEHEELASYNPKEYEKLREKEGLILQDKFKHSNPT